MTRARKGSFRRRLTGAGRLMLAAGLLATLGWAALEGVSRTNDADERGRMADRAQVTKALAGSFGLQAGLDAAGQLAQDASTLGAGVAVERYKPGPSFREAFVLAGASRGNLRRAAGSLRYVAADGTILACSARGGAVLDDGLRALAQAAASGPPLMRAFDSPACVPVVAAASRSGDFVAVVLADRTPLLTRVEGFAALSNGRVFLLAGDSLVADSVSPAPTDVVVFLQKQPTSGVARVGDAGAAVIRSWAQIVPGWTLVVEQDAAAFSEHRVTHLSAWIPAGIAACFALALIVVGFFDVRRRKALARADQDRASFLAVVGHELRTPLTVMKGFVDTLSARWEQLQEAQRQNLVERLGPQVRRLGRGVDRLLIAADIQRGAHLRPSQEPVMVQQALTAAADSFRPLAPLHAFTVEAEAAVVVTGDRKFLGQVLDQLVDNAVKYSPSGGTVLLQARQHKSRVELVVQDEGVGLPADTSRLFEPLTQGEDIDRRVHDEGGVGVGLFIARTLTEAMGGSLRAERRGPEPGTRFVVTLRGGASTEGAQLAPPTRVHGQS